MNEQVDLDAIRLEVVMYFRRNPFARETAESLSLRVGRPSPLVSAGLERLVEQTILQRRGEGAAAMYRYARPYLQGTGLTAAMGG